MIAWKLLRVINKSKINVLNANNMSLVRQALKNKRDEIVI
jgi:hypothetical protein